MKTINKVAVIMTVYNTPYYMVKRAIDSVLKQTFQDFELLIIDDGSSYDSNKLILEYAIQNEDKITYLRHKNCSQSESINRGISLINSEYVTIIDSDDEYKPNHLEICLAEIKTFDLIASTTETIVNNESDYYVPDRFNQSVMIHVDECILFATLFGKIEVFKSLNFINMYGADANFYERAKKHYYVEKLNLRTYIYYRNNSDSISAKVKIEKIN